MSAIKLNDKLFVIKKKTISLRSLFTNVFSLLNSLFIIIQKMINEHSVKIECLIVKFLLMVKLKLKTCNNHFCKAYYKNLCKSNFRSCLLMLYNSYDEIELTLFSRLFGNLVENTPIIDYVPAFDIELRNIYHCLLSRYIHLNKLPF